MYGFITAATVAVDPSEPSTVTVPAEGCGVVQSIDTRSERSLWRYGDLPIKDVAAGATLPRHTAADASFKAWRLVNAVGVVPPVYTMSAYTAMLRPG